MELLKPQVSQRLLKMIVAEQQADGYEIWLMVNGFINIFQ